MLSASRGSVGLSAASTSASAPRNVASASAKRVKVDVVLAESGQALGRVEVVREDRSIHRDTPDEPPNRQAAVRAGRDRTRAGSEHHHERERPERDPPRCARAGHGAHAYQT